MEDRRKTINVVAALIFKDGKIFSTQRGKGQFKDFWEFPGGKIEENESPEEALKREIIEELNTVIEVEELFDIIKWEYPDFNLNMRCYKCKVLEGELELIEHEDSKWLSLNTIDKVKWLPADIQLIPKIKKHLK